MNKQYKDGLANALLENSALDLYAHILKEYTVEDLLALCHQTAHYRLAFRAAWTLEHVLLKDKVLLSRYTPEVIELYLITDNDSSLRSISKLIMQLLKTSLASFTPQHQEDILSKTFRLIEKEDCPVALLVNCWDILYVLSKQYDWITQELQLYILFHLEKNPTPASKSRGNRILNRLH